MVEVDAAWGQWAGALHSSRSALHLASSRLQTEGIGQAYLFCCGLGAHPDALKGLGVAEALCCFLRPGGCSLPLSSPRWAQEVAHAVLSFLR